MQIDKLSPEWVFQQHARPVVKRWLSQLQYFYFMRAWGGHANDGDSFKTAFLFSGRNGLAAIMEQLGIKLNTIPANYPEPVLGKSYSPDEFSIFKHRIATFNDLEQPGYTKNIWV